ncbi:MAG TPA: asparagine synthase (glutamine-hydrolyzing) [Geminicoccaceae bacterium]|nr:asparagine synthase (glutamine-hydrolyzing) [Geminicoccaceae bacterium]
MCGIAGCIGSARSSAEVRRMLDALRHRGPDDEWIWQGEAASLGHRRLSIIDLAGGRQPIANEDETLWVICNGEIYNYQNLRQELLRKGHRFRTSSDTEVILHLYEEEGDRCVERLRGMFAFALWDVRRRRLFAARDRLGQKPFYYVCAGSELLFASEIKALLALDPSFGRMDLEALHQYLTLRLIAPPRSMFRAIRKLPPAHTLAFGPDGRLEIRRYWNLTYEPKLRGSEEDLVDELEERLVEAIRAHMVSDVPVGAFVSGGLDSTLVTALLMKHVAQAPIQTFSVGLPYREYDEAPYARLVAERYGTEHHEQTLVPSLIETLPELIWHLDEPSDPLAVCTYTIAKMARAHVKVVLGGDGGDELFGGYDRYYANRYASYYALLPEAVRRHAIGPLLERMPQGAWYKSVGHQLRYLHRASFKEGGARYAHSLAYFYFDDLLQRDLYGPAMAETVRTFDPYQAIGEYVDQAPATDPVDRMLYADHQIRLPDHPVMILDRMTMAHGLEARSPFMDHEVAEFCARLPVRLKVRGRTLRYIERQLARRYLPREVLERRKQGFSSALPYMLRDEFRRLFQLFLRDSHLAQAGIFRQPAVDRLLEEHLVGGIDHGNRLWLLLNSELWYRMFIDGLGRDDLKALLAGAPVTSEPPAPRPKVAALA